MGVPDLQIVRSQFSQYSAVKGTPAGYDHLRCALETARRIVDSSTSRKKCDAALSIVAQYALEFEGEAKALFAKLKKGWPSREVWHSFYGRARLFVEFGFRDDAEFANLLDNFEMFAIYAKKLSERTGNDVKSLRRIFRSAKL